MNAPVFVYDAVLPPGVGDSLVIDGPEGRHAVSVRRVRSGEVVDLVNRRGMRLRTRIITAQRPDRLEVEVLEVVVEPTALPRLVVAQALAKGEHADRAVAMLTEVGVDRVIPWAAARCVARWPDQQLGLERWQRIADEAAKQARRARFPEVSPLANTEQLASLCADASCAYVLHEGATARLAAELADPAPPPDVLLVVGPEGGIADGEIQTLEAAGAVAVRLGDSILRTSTAGTVGAALLASAFGRWS